MTYDWAELAALAVIRAIPADGSELSLGKVVSIIHEQCPYKPGIEYRPTDQPTLLQCRDCKNTESPAGALGRGWNRGRCLQCGGYFEVTRA